MKVAFFVSLCLICFSCKKEVSVKEENKPVKNSFKYYEMSEMALLMEQMYVDNMRIRESILSQEAATVDHLPAHYLKLEKAVLTDPTDRDLFFTTQLAQFLEAQTRVYEITTDRKENFNAMVQSCIDCHKVKCGGPIERIKKLLIH